MIATVPPTFPVLSYHRLILFGLSVAFALSYTQSPLYWSNQNQYFLHGLAAAEEGQLARDWLAQTIDPTPVFSGFVAFTARYLHKFVVFQGLYFLALMAYFRFLLAVGVKVVFRDSPNARRIYLLAVLLILVHGAAIRFLSTSAVGLDYPWYLQAGVAGQYILGPGLQPSVSGIFLLGAVAAFLYDRNKRTIGAIVFSCMIHPTYLLPAALLTIAFMTILLRNHSAKKALTFGSLVLLLVIPIVISAYLSFSPTAPDLFTESQIIIAEFRIPHHAQIDRWFDTIAALQIGWLALAICLVRRHRIFLVLLIPALTAIVLSIIQYLTKNPTLALFFPWRISAILIPIATVINLGYLSRLAPERAFITHLATVVLGMAVGGGIAIMATGIGFGTDDRELPVLKFIRDNQRSGDCYLIPVRIPKANPKVRGVVSTTFTPPPRGNQNVLIVVDLQRFRLFTGVPIYIDFKSIPYKDRDVIEWRRRVDNSVHWLAQDYRLMDADFAAMKQVGITHILVPAERSLEGTGLKIEYSDDYYKIYRLNN